MSVVEKDHGWKRIQLQLRKLKGSHVNIGVLSDAGTYGTSSKTGKKNGKFSKKKSGSNLNLADVAAFNEFGSSRIPPRPFMGQAFDKNQGEIKAIKEKVYSDVLEGTKTAEKALDTIGVFFKGKVGQTIAQGDFAPNSPVTIAMKGSDKPLIDNGRLRQSIQFEVKLK